MGDDRRNNKNKCTGASYCISNISQHTTTKNHKDYSKTKRKNRKPKTENNNKGSLESVFSV